MLRAQSCVGASALEAPIAMGRAGGHEVPSTQPPCGSRLFDCPPAGTAQHSTARGYMRVKKENINKKVAEKKGALCCFVFNQGDQIIKWPGNYSALRVATALKSQR